MMFVRNLFAISLALASIACTTPGQIPSLQHEKALPAEQQHAQEELVSQAVQFHTELKRRGLISTDTQTNAYVRSIGASLMPEFTADQEIRFYVLRNPTANAFATANGNIYINLGLLAVLENRDQLAMVSAHEIAHVIQRHHLKDFFNNRNTIVAAHIANLMLFGTNLVYLPASASLAGFSREHELAADTLGLSYLPQAGHDPSRGIGAYKVFRSLPESAALKGSMFSSHPENEDRIANLTKVSVQRSTAYDPVSKHADESFVAIRKKAARKAVRYRLRDYQPMLAIDLLERVAPIMDDTPEYYYLLGEAYRLLAEEPTRAADEEARLEGKRTASKQRVTFYREKVGEHRNLARQAYRKALHVDRDYPQTYKGMGLLANSEGKSVEALENLRAYLALEEHPKDVRFINRLVSTLEGETYD